MNKTYTCISNSFYPNSLTIGQQYTALIDQAAQSADMLRIIDNTGQSYLFPAKLFQE